MLIDDNGNKVTPKEKAKELIELLLDVWLFDIDWVEHGELKNASEKEINLVYEQMAKIVKRILKKF